jgi:hypothetical protein
MTKRVFRIRDFAYTEFLTCTLKTSLSGLGHGELPVISEFSSPR